MRLLRQGCAVRTDMRWVRGRPAKPVLFENDSSDAPGGALPFWTFGNCDRGDTFGYGAANIEEPLGVGLSDRNEPNALWQFASHGHLRRQAQQNRGSAAQGAIADGGTISQDHTLTPVEVDEVLNALDPQVRDQLNMVINTLGQATAGRGQDMNAAAADLSSVAVDLKVLAHTLANNSDHLDALIADLRKVMETLAAWHADFRSMIADWDHVMATLASREQNLQGTIVEQDRVMGILDQALSGGAAQQLQGALAEAPAAIDNANHYLGDAATVFGVVQTDTPAIQQLFRELASVMSGIGHPDEPGSNPNDWVHMWRVHCADQCFKPGVP